MSKFMLVRTGISVICNQVIPAATSLFENLFWNFGIINIVIRSLKDLLNSSFENCPVTLKGAMIWPTYMTSYESERHKLDH